MFGRSDRSGASNYGRGMQLLAKDDDMAFEYILRAAEKAYVPAFYQLGRMYETGRHVKKDRRRSMRWYSEAYVAGMDDAAVPMAHFHVQGMFPEYDEAECLMLLEVILGDRSRGLIERHVRRLSEIGRALCGGSGSFRNIEMGLRVLREAACSGDSAAESFLRNRSAAPPE